MINFRKIALCAPSILMALLATLLPMRPTNIFATDASPQSCKDGYEYVEAVGKCYKKCAEGWERNSETLRCRKIRTEAISPDEAPASKDDSSATDVSSTDNTSLVEAATSSDSSNTPSSPSSAKTSSPSTSSSSSESSATKSCKDGYEYVEAVGKCYKKCAEGWERNPETNRCRKATIESDYEASSSSSKPTAKSSSSQSSKSSSIGSAKSCKDGYEYVASAGKCYKACAENQIRNPETNRCKKVEAEAGTKKTTSKSQAKNDGADYEIDVPSTGSKNSFVAVGSVVALIAAGLVFGLFQYRVEIRDFLKKHIKKAKK